MVSLVKALTPHAPHMEILLLNGIDPLASSCQVQLSRTLDNAISSVGIQTLCPWLEKCVKLEVLWLNRNKVLSLDPQFAKAVASLPRIREVMSVSIVHALRRPTHRNLTGSQSQATKAKLPKFGIILGC